MTLSCKSESRHTIMMYKMNLFFLGVWPFQNKGIMTVVHFSSILFSQITFAFPQYVDLFYNLENSENTIENLTANVVINMVMLKLITLLLHRESMAKCVKSVVNDWNKIRDRESYNIMKRHRALGKIVFFGLKSMLYTTMVMYVILATVVTASSDCSKENVTQNCKMLPFRGNYLINTDPSPIYEIILLVQTVQGFITCTGNYGIDAFMFFLTMHLCGQLELLKTDFRQLLRVSEFPLSEFKTTRVKIFRKKILDLTKRHYELIEFSERLENTFNVMILGQLLVSSVMICVLGLQFILCLENGNLLSVGKYTFYMIAIMMQLFLYSFAGDYLQSQSFGLAYAVYESQWYDLPPAVARDLLFVMIRAGNPLRISAGKFFVMTLQSFKVIVKTSGSYLSVLHVMLN